VSRPLIGFAGLTHLGLVSAGVAASKGFRIIAFDPDGARVTESAAVRLPVMEPGLEELLRDSASCIVFTERAAALAECDVVYIASDVPTDASGDGDLCGLASLIPEVIPTLGRSAVLVVLSQVPPGFTRAIGFPPERLFCQVETLVIGRAVERATQPERFIVGCADPEAPLPGPYAAVLGAFRCPILRMRYESAELAKIAINCCLAATVGMANTLAELSERVGADWGEIVPALRLDRRIGQHAYLAAGLGLGGGNLERDLATVLRLSAATGSDAAVIRSCVDNSRHRGDWALRTLHAEVLRGKPDAVIGILGLAYKENTRSTKNSPSLALIGHLGPWRLRVYDPVVPATEAGHPAATPAVSALDAARGADVLTIMTPWPEFRDLAPRDLASAMAGHAVVDPYRMLDAAEVVAAGLDYFTLGAPPRRAGRAQP
jgi:UDPglucose 6-dehydrogenase